MVQLPGEISEEDRSFFMVLDISLSQYHLHADIGYYYEAECEDTFSFNRLQVASEYFHYYRCHQALKPWQKIFVKYVNVTTLLNKKSNSDLEHIKANIIKEYNLIKNYSGSGLVDVFLIFCRVPNVFYVFLERPDETLEEYLRRYNQNNLNNYSIDLKSFRPVQMIPFPCFRRIVKLLATTLLELHNKRIYHTRLTADSVFLFFNDRITEGQSQSHRTKSDRSKIVSVKQPEESEIIAKLANFAFAEVFDQAENIYLDKNNSKSNVTQLENTLRTRELLNLYDLVTRIIESTEFENIQEQEKFTEMTTQLIWPVLDKTSKEDLVVNPDRVLSKNLLETFVESLWMDS